MYAVFARYNVNVEFRMNISFNCIINTRLSSFTREVDYPINGMRKFLDTYHPRSQNSHVCWKFVERPEAANKAAMGTNHLLR